MAGDDHRHGWPERPALSERDLFRGYGFMTPGPETPRPPRTAQVIREAYARTLAPADPAADDSAPCVCRHTAAWHADGQACAADVDVDGAACYCPGYLSVDELEGRIR